MVPVPGTASDLKRFPEDMIICQEGFWGLLEYDSHPIQEPLWRQIVVGQTGKQGMANATRRYINEKRRATKHTYIHQGRKG